VASACDVGLHAGQVALHGRQLGMLIDGLQMERDWPCPLVTTRLLCTINRTPRQDPVPAMPAGH
jgi:hypothetical protein